AVGQLPGHAQFCLGLNRVLAECGATCRDRGGTDYGDSGPSQSVCFVSVKQFQFESERSVLESREVSTRAACGCKGVDSPSELRAPPSCDAQQQLADRVRPIAARPAE